MRQRLTQFIKDHFIRGHRLNSTALVLWSFGIIILVGALLLTRGIFFYQLAAWASCRAMGKQTMGTEYTLEKSEILAVRGKDSTRYPYSACMQLLETEHSIYFMMTDGQGLILDKDNLRGGTVEELRSWLAEKTGKPLTWAGGKRAGEKAAKS